MMPPTPRQVQVPPDGNITDSGVRAESLTLGILVGIRQRQCNRDRHGDGGWACSLTSIPARTLARSGDSVTVNDQADETLNKIS